MILLEFRGTIEIHGDFQDLIESGEFQLSFDETKAQLVINHTEILKGKITKLNNPILSC